MSTNLETTAEELYPGDSAVFSNANKLLLDNTEQPGLEFISPSEASEELVNQELVGKRKPD